MSTRFAAAAMFLGGASLTLGGASAAAAGPIEVIFTNLAGHPTSAVPGLPGMSFNPGVTTQFDRPFVSPGGQRWIMRARLAAPATGLDNEVILVGSGRLGAVALREGAATGFMAGENFGSIPTAMGVNDAGQFVFANATTAPALVNDIIAKWNGSAFELVAREGGAAPGTGGGLYGFGLDSAGILADGMPYFRAAGIVQGARAGQTLWYRGQQIVSATLDPAFAPAGQLDDPSADWSALSPSRFRMDSTGANWIGVGALDLPVTAQALAVNNHVRSQQWTVIPGDPLGRMVSAGPGNAVDFISANGRHWMSRGTFVSTHDYVLRNGQIVAATFENITLRPGELERFDDASYAPTFFLNTGNSAGDYVIGGVTNNLSSASDAVVVLNRQRVILREGDPIDLNGNGVADDDAFIGVFNDDDAFLTDDGWFYFTADIRAGSGALTGQGFFRIKVCKADWDGSGGVNSSDIAAYIADWLASFSVGGALADFNHDGAVNSADISAFLGAWLDAIGGGC